MLNEKIEISRNLIQQKFVKVATAARIKDEDGKTYDYELNCLLKLNALFFFLYVEETPTFQQLREVEVLANNICGRDRFIFKLTDFGFIEYEGQEETEQIVPINSHDIYYEHPNFEAPAETVWAYMDRIIEMLQYQMPWIKFTVLTGIAPGTYEIGFPGNSVTLGVTVNKTALNTYDIDLNGIITQYSRELQNTLPDQTIIANFNFENATEYRLHGFYRDLVKYMGEHQEAQVESVWKSAWPWYYGTATIGAFDDSNTVAMNNFIHLLNKTFDYNPCLTINIPDGEVLYLFYPTTDAGVTKQFHSENGPISGSFKGVISGVTTKSAKDYNLPLSSQYGLIRTDQPGIGLTTLCVKDIISDAS
jgi:hypothetical protein